MALLTDKQFLVIGGVGLVVGYLAYQKSKAAAVAVVDAINPLSETGIAASIPNRLHQWTAGTEFTDNLREGNWAKVFGVDPVAGQTPPFMPNDPWGSLDSTVEF